MTLSVSPDAAWRTTPDSDENYVGGGGSGDGGSYRVDEDGNIVRGEVEGRDSSGTTGYDGSAVLEKQKIRLTNMNFKAYPDEEGNLLTSNELRNPFNTNSQTVIATITNKLNESCPAIAEIEFVVNPLPTFTVDDSTIVCLNLDPIPIGVTSAEAEYTYTWEHEDLNGNTTTFPSTEDTILIGVGGTYFVTATTTDGTNCSRTLSIDVDESIIATITLDDITVDDLTSDNTDSYTHLTLPTILLV